MSKRTVIISIIASFLVLIIGTNIYIDHNNAKIQVKTTKLQKSKYKTTIIVPGTLNFTDEQLIFHSTEKGYIENIKVKEGTVVQKGDIIATFENSDLLTEIENNELERISIDLRKKKLDIQKKHLEQRKKGLKKQLGSEDAQKEIELEQEVLRVDLDALNIEYRKNKLQADSLMKKQNDLQVTSTIDGIIVEVNETLPTEIESVPQPLIHIVGIDEFLAIGALSEYDISKVNVGQSVKVTSDALPNHTWKGIVQKVGILPENDSKLSGNSGVKYPLEVKVSGIDISKIKPGFKLLLEIETGVRESDMLPIEAVKNIGERTYIYTIKDNKAYQKEVEVGKATNKLIEVLSGASKEDIVILNPPENLSDGMEVIKHD